MKKLFEFNVPMVDLINIYILFTRSILEQSSVVWHSSITEGESDDLERVQKVSLRIILKEKYESYDNALKITGLDKLSDRRTQLGLNFAKNSVKNDKVSSMFPLNPSGYNMVTRNPEKFHVHCSILPHRETINIGYSILTKVAKFTLQMISW